MKSLKAVSQPWVCLKTYGYREDNRNEPIKNYSNDNYIIDEDCIQTLRSQLFTFSKLTWPKYFFEVSIVPSSMNVAVDQQCYCRIRFVLDSMLEVPVR